MEKQSTFLVTHADAASAVLKDADDGQVHTLAENPDLDANDALDATVASDELGVTWELVDIEERRPLTTGESEEPPTSQERELAAEGDEGDVTTRERAGVGEIHVLTVPPERVADAVSDVLDDEATLVRAARLGVNRVEVRSDGEAGVVSVRYLP
ncbi:DUF5812 family protein [Halococcus salsus]|uniref:DUF5812 family protein n=1 Tax=Halococcus salsus TaxID=2162894 RepID=UPI0013575C2D|nr:DUF5812 family protein [Halococcus salsus]